MNVQELTDWRGLCLNRQCTISIAEARWSKLSAVYTPPACSWDTTVKAVYTSSIYMYIYIYIYIGLTQMPPRINDRQYPPSNDRIRSTDLTYFRSANPSDPSREQYFAYRPTMDAVEKRSLSYHATVDKDGKIRNYPRLSNSAEVPLEFRTTCNSKLVLRADQLDYSECILEPRPQSESPLE